MAGLYLKAKQSADHLRSILPPHFRNPKAAIICGSGLGGLVNTIKSERKVVYDYDSIPHFPRPTGESSEGPIGVASKAKYYNWF